MNGYAGILNNKMIAKVLGVLLLVEALFFVLCALVSIIYNESDYIYFIYSILINITVGGFFLLLSKNANSKVTRRDGYLIVSLTWLLFTIFGMMPYYLGGYIPNITDAFFETMSGFTTTGSTIVDNLESFPHGMLFWRSLTQWIGGLGIVIFTIAVLPVFGGGTLQLFSAESTGVVHDKIHPKISSTANTIWIVYLVLTVIQTILLAFGGMSIFDAVCHSFATTSTGGYSTKQNSIAYWNSAYIEYVIIIFMLLSSMNFSIYFLCMKGKISKIIHNTEIKWFIGSVLLITLAIMFSLYFFMNYDLELAFRASLFQVSSIHTSCGFITDDYNLWPQYTWFLLIFAMIAGGCTGSTAGGIKAYRGAVIYKNIRNEFKKLIHPVAVLPIRMNKEVVPFNIVGSVKTFIIFYLAVFALGWFLLICTGVNITDSLGITASSIGNTGPGLGTYGAIFTWSDLPVLAKWIASFLMLIGRLELFSVLILFSPAFWSKQ